MQLPFFLFYISYLVSSLLILGLTSSLARIPPQEAMRSSLFPYLFCLLWLGLGLLLRGITASENTVKYVDENSETQIRFAADPWPERQADLERKWGFEVCLPFVASQFHSLSLSLPLSLSLSLSDFLTSRYRSETGVLYVYFAFPRKEMLIIQNKIQWGFSGISTFAHLPHVKCLTAQDVEFDIGIVGVPFDTAVSYRPGEFLVSCLFVLVLLWNS